MFFNHGFSRLNRFFDHEFDELNELFAFLAKAHPDGSPRAVRGSNPSNQNQSEIRVIRINPSNGLPISENLFNPQSVVKN